MTKGCPTTSAQAGNLSPADGLIGPTQGLSFGFPHGNHYGAVDQRRGVVGAGADDMAAVLLKPLRIEQIEPDPARGTPDVGLDGAVHDPLHRLAGTDGSGFDGDRSIASCHFAAIKARYDNVDPCFFLAAVIHVERYGVGGMSGTLDSGWRGWRWTRLRCPWKVTGREQGQ